MTFNNSILLKVKQSNGIEYNELFNSVVSGYNNQNSARAALSRALKNLEAFGQVKREGSRILLTDKGLASINVEMKDKLVLRLNDLMKKPLSDPEELVRLLIIVSQRGENDSDLLKNARDNSTFTITDIGELRREISERKKLLTRMDSLLSKQISKLKELDFNDIHSEKISPALAEKIMEAAEGDITVEAFDESLLESLPLEWKKQSKVIIKGKNVKELFSILEKFPSSKVILYITGIKAVLYGEKAMFYGRYNLIQKFR